MATGFADLKERPSCAGTYQTKDPNVQLNQERRALRRSFVLPVLHEANKTAR